MYKRGRRSYIAQLDSEVIDFSNCVDKIYPRLVSINNKELWKDRVHRIMYNDLVLTYYVRMFDNNEGCIRMPVTEKLLKEWPGVTEDDLFKIVKKEKCYVRDMLDYLVDRALKRMKESNNVNSQQLMDEIEEMRKTGLPFPMFIVGIKGDDDYQYYGAAAAFLGGIKEAENHVGKKFIIVPSSTHELIVIPYNVIEYHCIEIEELSNVIMFVNGDGDLIVNEDILSTHPYLYDHGVITSIY